MAGDNNDVVSTTPLRVPKPAEPKFNSEGKLETPCRICEKPIEDTSLGVLCSKCDQTTLTAPPGSGIVAVICKCNTTLHFSEADVAGICPNKNCNTKMIVNPPAEGYYVMCPHCAGVLTCPSKVTDPLAFCPTCKNMLFFSKSDRARFLQSTLIKVAAFLSFCLLLAVALPFKWYIVMFELLLVIPAALNLRQYFTSRHFVPMKRIQAPQIPCALDL